MRFSDIIGQQHIKEHFQSAVVNKKINHAYIINGEKSSGKAMLAKAFAMAIMCDGGGSEACMECDSCRTILNNCNPDVYSLVKDTSKKTGIIGINEIRQQIISTIYDRPYGGDHKVYIIEDADLMNDAAQNALLKTLEEPPEYAVILLITRNASKLLPTILSRCIILNTRPVEDSVVKKYLRDKYRFLDTEVDVITAMASGNIGRAKLLSEDGEFIKFKNSVLDILKALPDSDLRRVMEAVSVLSKIKKEEEYSVDDIMELFVFWYRDVLLYKATGEFDDLIFKDETIEIALQAKYFSYEALDYVIKEINKARQKMNTNLSFETICQLLLINIQEKSK